MLPTRNLSTIVSAPSLNQSSPETQIHQLKFNDKTVAYTYSQIEEIPFFYIQMQQNKRLTEVEFSNVSSLEFELMCNLFIRFQHLTDVAASVELSDPQFYIRCAQLIKILFDDQTPAVMNTFCEEIKALPYDTALNLLQNVDDIEDHIFDSELPFYACIVRDIVGRCTLCFDSVSDFHDSFSGPLLDLQKQILGLQTFSSQQNTHMIKELCSICTGLKKSLRGLVAPSKLLTWSQRNKEADIATNCGIYLARRYFNIYQHKIMITFQYTFPAKQFIEMRHFENVDVDKNLYAELFAYYDLSPRMHLPDDYSWITNWTSSFSHKETKTRFGYIFDPRNIHSVEDKIREDLSTFKTDLKPPYLPAVIPLKSQATEATFTEDVKALRNATLHYFSMEEKSEYEIKKMKVPLLKHWGWSKLYLNPWDFKLTMIPSQSQIDHILVRGCLKQYLFVFSTHDFKPIILHPDVDPNPEQSKIFIESLKLDRINYSFFSFFC